MVALCRYREPSDRIRVAVYETPDPSSSAPLKSSPRVCPLSEWIGEAEEELLANTGSVFDLPAERFAQWVVTDDSKWQSPPVTFLPPVATTEKVICIGLNYLDHAIETGAEPPSEPVVFSKFGSCLIGHGDAIVLPRISGEVDYEAELVVVIGKTARHVSKSEALDYVFGYTAGHDVSARDWQKGRPGGQWLLGKAFDTFAPVGPAVVTADEFGDPGAKRVRMWLNDEPVQDSTTSQLIFDVPTLVSHLSGFFTLRPGDLIFTGTPPGVGAARTPPRFLANGDVCTVDIQGIGPLSNPCHDESE